MQQHIYIPTLHYYIKTLPRYRGHNIVHEVKELKHKKNGAKSTCLVYKPNTEARASPKKEPTTAGVSIVCLYIILSCITYNSLGKKDFYAGVREEE